MTEQVANKESIGAALGRIPSGVFIITAKDGDEKVGMLASWVMQAGFEPPTVTVGVHPDRELYKAIQASGTFSINVLSNENMTLMKAFGKYSPDQFDGVDFADSNWGITLNEAVAVLHCKLKEEHAGADHNTLLAEVQDGAYMNADLDPMVHLRKSGFHY